MVAERKKERRKVIEKENSYDELNNADLILCNNEKNQKHHKIWILKKAFKRNTNINVGNSIHWMSSEKKTADQKQEKSWTH